jgi:hypothetical protein
MHVEDLHRGPPHGGPPQDAPRLKGKVRGPGVGPGVEQAGQVPGIRVEARQVRPFVGVTGPPRR